MRRRAKVPLKLGCDKSVVLYVERVWLDDWGRKEVSLDRVWLLSERGNERYCSRQHIHSFYLLFRFPDITHTHGLGNAMFQN